MNKGLDNELEVSLMFLFLFLFLFSYPTYLISCLVDASSVFVYRYCEKFSLILLILTT